MKVLRILTFCMFLLAAVSGFAAEESGSGMDWQISMQPQQTAAEKEAARWTEVMENSTGRYYVARDSVYMTKGPFGDKDRNILQTEIKTVFLNDGLKQHLDTQVFVDKLASGDNVDNCVQVLLFNLRAKSSTVSCKALFTAKTVLCCSRLIKSRSGSQCLRIALPRSCWKC